MKIPESFKRAQKRVFQDKVAALYKKIESTGSLGSVTTDPDDKGIDFRGNVQIVNDETVITEYGLVAGTDICITTCDFSIDAVKGDFVKYNGHFYEIVGAPNADSHITLLCKRR